MGTHSLNAAADHGSTYGAHKALDMLAVFRTGPLVACRHETARGLVFVQAGAPARELCGCGKSDCQVQPLFAAWRALCDSLDAEHIAVSVTNGSAVFDAINLQCDLAYRAYRLAEQLCRETAAAHEEAAHSRILDASDRAREWADDDR